MDGTMPVDTDDIPESAVSRVRHRWNRLRVAIRNQRGPTVNSDVENAVNTKSSQAADEKQPRVSYTSKVLRTHQNELI
jgi:hypothetical protein